MAHFGVHNRWKWWSFDWWRWLAQFELGLSVANITLFSLSIRSFDIRLVLLNFEFWATGKSTTMFGVDQDVETIETYDPDAMYEPYGRYG